MELERLEAVFDAKPLTPEKIAVYVQRLSDLDAATLRAAVDRLIDTHASAFLPTIADIKMAARDLTVSPNGHAADLAWCLDWLRHDDRAPEVWPNPVCQEAMRLLGGWQVFRESNPDFLPREWEKVWNEARQTVTRQFVAGELRRLPEPDGIAIGGGS
jgi:hypothetical protein